MSVLSTVNPFTKYLYAGAALAVVAGLAFTHLTVYRTGRHAVQAEWDAANARDVEQGAKETQRRLERQGDSNRETAKAIASVSAQRDAAIAAAGGLRSAVDQLRARVDSATVAQRETAAGAIDLLANVLARADARAGELAEYADRARIAGQQCERDYDTLTPR